MLISLSQNVHSKYSKLQSRWFVLLSLWNIHGINKLHFSDRKIVILLEYNYIIVLRCVVQKLCVAKNCVPLVYLSQIYGTLYMVYNGTLLANKSFALLSYIIL